VEAELDPSPAARAVPAAGRQHDSLVNAVSLSLATVLVMALSNLRRGGTARPDSLRDPHPRLHPDHRRAGDGGRPGLQRIPARHVPGARHIHPADRHQLHRAGPCRGLRRQERPARGDLRWPDDGRRLRLGDCPARCGARVDRPRNIVLRHRDDLSDAVRRPGLAGILSRLPDRHPAARRLLRPRAADRRAQLARCARQRAPARTAPARPAATGFGPRHEPEKGSRVLCPTGSSEPGAEKRARIRHALSACWWPWCFRRRPPTRA
jgi:hypothetical protein